RLGGRIPKGVLLMGPPGTGKTLLAKGVAGEAGVPFFSISGSDFVEMFVGVGASRVRDLFEQGKKNAPCIIFIDEIDAVGRHRGAGLGGGHDEREQTLNQLLVEMDGFESNDGVILVAATNRPDVLDPALLRPGRFDRRVVVNRPDVKGRLEILKVHTRKARVSKDVDLEVIARSTPGFAGADLENLVNEAALVAARHDKDYIEMADFESAKDKVLMGAERKSAVLSEEEKKITAYHEAGHALVARMVKGNDPVHKVTIIPRGMALGLTWTLPESDVHAYAEDQVLARIAMAMGGRVAEELAFDRITTGAGNDIEQATKLARRMVCEWGMSRLGPIAITKNEGSIFLGRDIGRQSDFSEHTQAEADTEIKRIVTEQYELAKQIVRDHREVLERMAQALLEVETLSGVELEMVYAGATAAEIRDAVKRKEKGGGTPGATLPTPRPTEPPKPEKAIVPDLPEPVGSARSRLDPDD
ncbi:MAG: ATP-dependent zinc metalloprotease FtsH, partial [Deltaproteobacteria bacterium]|nr:ATP-dependent zinc metalloprotease FtsH [Deltaproteobacteria bacterium]